MTGLFNTIGHETAGATSEAASHVFEGLAGAHRALARAERNDRGAAEADQRAAAGVLILAAAEFEALAERANDRPIATRSDAAANSPLDPMLLAELHGVLSDHGISAGLRNRDLFQIPAREARSLADALTHANFVGRHADWYVFRDVLAQVNRLTSLGVALSRLAAFDGSDPDLLE